MTTLVEDNGLEGAWDISPQAMPMAVVRIRGPGLSGDSADASDPSPMVLCLLSAALRAQTPAPAKLEFEVASVKLMTGGGMMGVKVYPGGRVILSGLSLKNLIAAAYRLSFWQISGGEDWMSKDRYVVEAKPPEDLQAPIRDLRYTLFGIEDERLCEMLQALLQNRFQLQVHRDTRTGDVYQLMRNDKTLRLTPREMPAGELTDRDLFGSIGYAGGRWGIFTTSMPQLARFAASFVFQAAVVDRTGLAGTFDYRQYGGDQADSFKGFLSEMGLKVEKGKGPVEMLVLDRATRPPAN